jgi:large subunit ribosomal protein L29
MKMEEIKQMSDADLQERIDITREELSKLRFNHSIAGLENTDQLRLKRKDVARLMTELNARKAKQG